jgi:hypothetical protein
MEWSMNREPIGVPRMIEGEPTPGTRVKQTLLPFVGTDIHHSLYLPSRWRLGALYPVVVEYTGNYHLPTNSTGKVEDASLGFGLLGGKDFIWNIATEWVEENLLRSY